MHINYLYLHFAGCYSFFNISLLTKRPGHAALMADRSILDQVQKLQQIVFRGLLMSFDRYSWRWLCLRFFVPLHRHMNLVDAMVNLFAIILCVVVLDERGSPAHITIQSSSVFSPSCLWKAGGSNETEKKVSSVHQVECNYLNSDPPWYHATACLWWWEKPMLRISFVLWFVSVPSAAEEGMVYRKHLREEVVCAHLRCPIK